MKSFVLLGLGLLPSLIFANCLEILHIHRDVAGGIVEHEYIGMVFFKGHQVERLESYGFTKDGEDQNYLIQLLAGEIPEQGVEIVGSLCGGANVERARAIAWEISEEWKANYKNWLYFTGRMLVTPLVGKPCGNAALQIKKALREAFHF